MRIIGAIMASAILFGGAAGALAHERLDAGPAADAGTRQMAMPMADMKSSAVALPAKQLARARVATAKYANDLGAAKADGYSILTQKIPGMGYHFINPSVKGFDVTRPAILVYEKARKPLAARRARVGVPEEARDAAAEGRHVRLVPGRVPLQGRHVRDRGRRQRLRLDEPAVRARASPSGTRSSSPCTSGPGTRTRVASTRA